MEKYNLLCNYFELFDLCLSDSVGQRDLACNALEDILSEYVPPQRKRLLSQFARSLIGAHRLASSLNGFKTSIRVGVYVISLKDSPRRELILSRHTNKLARFFDYYVLDAVNPRDKTFDFREYSAVKSECIPAVFTSGVKSLGHFGCSISHSLAWEQACLNKSIDYALILEDDSCLNVSAVQVVDSVLREINCHPDKEVDLVFINNRSARWLSDSFERCLPPINKFLVPFGEFAGYIKESRKNSPAIWDGVNSHIFGGDAYLLTSTGLQKLFKFVHEHGIYPLGGEDLDVGIEKYLCNWLSTSVDDNGIAGRPTSLEEIHFSSDRPYLNTYVARFPFSISLQELSFDICQSQTSFSK